MSPYCSWTCLQGALSCICDSPGLVYSTKTCAAPGRVWTKKHRLVWPVYAVGARVVSRRVYPTEAFTAPGRVYTTEA
jgi:hypothetical protein